jgi:uncharacterized membrane protein YidH (DUF202 family)
MRVCGRKYFKSSFRYFHPSLQMPVGWTTFYRVDWVAHAAGVGLITKKISAGWSHGRFGSRSRDKATVLAEERTDLAVQRTLMAAEGTLMAWIRRSISMIGFGFAFYKFFQYMPEEVAFGNIQRPQAPRNLGLTLIALGSVALAGAAWQHRNFLRAIGPSYTGHCRSRSSWRLPWSRLEWSCSMVFC